MLKILPAFFTVQSLQAPESWGIWKEYRLRHQEAVIYGFCVVGKDRFDDGVGPTW